MSLKDYRFDRDSAAAALQDDGTFSFVLLCLVLAYLPEGDDDLSTADIEAVLSDMEEDFGIKIPDENVNKIYSATNALTTDYFWTDENVMRATALTFDDGDAGNATNGEYEDVDVAQILWAAMEVGLINDMSFEDSLDNFTDQLSDVINKTIESEGYDAGEEDISEEQVSRIPYYGKIINGKLMLLCGQLANLAGDNKQLGLELDEVASQILSENNVDLP